MLSEICVKNADKKQGYVLKDQFCPENQRKNPGKRLKPN